MERSRWLGIGALRESPDQTQTHSTLTISHYLSLSRALSLTLSEISDLLWGESKEWGEKKDSSFCYHENQTENAKNIIQCISYISYIIDALLNWRVFSVTGDALALNCCQFCVGFIVSSLFFLFSLKNSPRRFWIIIKRACTHALG